MELSFQSLHCGIAMMEFAVRLHPGLTMPMLFSPAGIVARSSGFTNPASASFERDVLLAGCYPGWRSPSWLRLSNGVRTLQVLTRHDCSEL